MMFVLYNNNTAGSTNVAVIAYPSRAPGFTPFLWGSCCSIFSFPCSILMIIVCLFVIFIFAIALSGLRLTASD